MAERAPFPFVVGCGRSGTTLVQAMLDAHPDIAVPFESYFPVWFARERSRYEQAGGFAVARFADDVLAHDSFIRWGLDASAVRARLLAAAPTDFAAAVRVCYAAFADAHGKHRYGDKTPIFVMHIPLLARLFPEAVFVHMIRDGRDVALSRTEVAWGTRRFAQEALRWREQIEQGRRDGRALGAARYHELRYESLLDDPEGAARELCAFIAADFDPAMLQYHEQPQRVLESQPFPSEHQNLRRPPTKGMRSWRGELTPEQIALFDSLAGPTLQRFGYAMGGAAASPRVRLDALGARAEYTAREQYRRGKSAAWRVVHARRGA